MMTPSLWLKPSLDDSPLDLRLFCFPYAGGSAVIFRRWANYVPKQVEVRPIELPGRGRRLHESLVTRMHELVPAIASTISPALDIPFALLATAWEPLLRLRLQGI